MKETIKDMQREMERTSSILMALASKTGLRDVEDYD